ncbi:CubicO group peptidase (beta-lactamase class C family) [Amycolatopsis echigonensis]|uniref:CubicO group peptidase (Beta-lactamase class C family) n=1 Tax=Amycolatopsis echigonensis TaxID=2576905 RepID=A0A2N3WML1_9PSEU|nr:serine hydrolase domain-containing protein [Amycolatopsis niigatensis]PKV95104.1 CubicO group peptidase (beta-lactamase class C family) [Amycolatopsis niigatensis]
MMHEVLRRHVDSGFVPGAVALVARGDEVQVTAVGNLDVEGTAPMTRDTIFRLASITKPITAAAVLMLVEDGRFGLDTPVAEWLPELADPKVVRTPESPVDDVVPAKRQITVRDLLTFRAGYGFPSDFSLPQVQELRAVQTDGREVRLRPEPDEWLARLARLPLLHQPGEAWLYDTCADLQGILIARASGQSLPDFLAERLFEPLGMVDTAFEVPAAKRHRFASYYRGGENGLELADAPDGQWREVPRFPAGSGGLVSAADDWLRFARMLLSDGAELLSKESVRQMTTNHLTAEQIAANPVFLEGQGWGFGGAVDVEPTEPWQVPGRYGWVGGTGTSAYLTPSTGSVAILLTQRGVDGPGGIPQMRDFWREAAAPE